MERRRVPVYRCDSGGELRKVAEADEEVILSLCEDDVVSVERVIVVDDEGDLASVGEARRVHEYEERP